MFEELQRIQDGQREGCMIPLPPPQPRMDVIDQLVASLQDGDVALVLTRRDLNTLAAMADRTARTPDEIRIYQNLVKLKEARR